MRRIPTRLVRGLLAGSALLAAAAAIIAASGGGRIELGSIVLRSHNPVRPLVAAIVLAACACATGLAPVRAALAGWWAGAERHAALGAGIVAACAIAVGVAWGTFVAGGSDSYCYLNQAELFTHGQVRDFEPLATDPAYPGNVWSFAPAGHRPAANAPGYYVPICPAGYPALLAAARILGGRTAMFWVTPVMGGLTVFLAFVLGARLGGRVAGLLAAVLTACSPIVLYQIVQPMNDIPATAVWLAALTIASSSWRGDARRAMLAGLLTACALTIRPNLVPLAAVTGLAAAMLPRGRSRRQRVAALAFFGLGALPGVAAVMAVQWAMYGSPTSSGYGDLSLLFSMANVMPNLARYPRWLVSVHTPLVVAGLAAPLLLKGEARRLSAWLLLFSALTFGLYLPYVVFDAWWYLRFVLPAVPLLLALASAVIVELVRRFPADIRVVVLGATSVALAILFVSTAASLQAFGMRHHEWRFRSAGEYVTNLPANAVLIAGHQTGSVRFYSGRRSAGWGDLDPGRLDEALRFFRQKGLKPYFLLEEWEEPMFRTRFSRDRLGGLGWPPVAEIDGYVRIYDPEDYDRYLRGETVETSRILTTPF